MDYNDHGFLALELAKDSTMVRLKFGSIVGVACLFISFALLSIILGSSKPYLV
jgi:hypothetical protein